MTEAYIIDAARTPRGIGKAGKGALSEFHPSRLLAKVFEGIGERNNLNTKTLTMWWLAAVPKSVNKAPAWAEWRP